MVAYLQKSKGSEGFHQIVKYSNTCHIKYALIENPTIYVSLIEQFWQTAIARTLENGDMEITATIDGKAGRFFRIFYYLTNLFEHAKETASTVTPKNLYCSFSYPKTVYQYEEGFKGIYGVESHHTPTVAPLTSQPHHSPTLRDFIRQETEVPQPSSPTQTHVADEAASIGVDDKHGGAATTVFGLEAGQGYRVAVLENDLKQTKKTYGAAFTKLIKKGSRSFNLGRKITKINEDPDISLLTAPEEVYTAELDISTANVPVSTGGAEVSTATESLVYIKRGATKRKDKGKPIVEESDPTQTKTKIQQEQERLGFEEAQRLQEQFDEEERQRIASVYEEVSTFKHEEWDNIQAQIEVDEELAHRLQAQERERYSEVDKAKLLIELINERKRQFAQQRAQQNKDMLKSFDRDDLVKLWDLVRERFSSTEPTDDKERALWVELKRLFEHDTDDLLEL
ncbi:hypothetical protein Tco_1041485 [Tanacetum coccineum]|uniref:Xylulose kinase-1 n=1 Tax=Tanacetum coccineum TaxID=301880 RepID=A0ABQ5GHR9_9ASTR